MTEPAIVERSIENFASAKSPLFEYAVASEQIRAAWDFIGYIKGYVSDPSKLDYIAEVQELLRQTDDPQYAKRLAINCFDFCVSDEIRIYEVAHSLPTDAAAVYFRSDVYKTEYPNRLSVAIHAEIGYPPQDLIVAPAELVEVLEPSGNLGMLTEKVAYIANESNQVLDRPYPPVGMPRQELYRELMSCGINPIEGNDTVESMADTSDNYVYRRLHRIRGKLALCASEADLIERKKYIESHWLSVLSETSEGHVTLFSSGVSSNEASMRAAANVSERVYVHPYWYYENVSTIRSIFASVEDDLSQATALLINLEPTNYFTFREHPEQPATVMRRFIDQAVANQGQQYNLIIDATVNPLFSIGDVYSKAQLPKNLSVTKTISATKHQDGGRSYFFGVVHTDSAELREGIIENKNLAGGVVYESHIVHFPVPSRRRIEYRRHVVSRLNSELEAITSQSDGWKYEAYSYHSFLMPPEEFLKQVALVVDGIENDEDREQYIRKLNKEIYEVVCDVSRLCGSGVEVGDSFAFPATRANTQGGLNEIGSYDLALKIPRIALGYRDGQQTGLLFATKLAERLNEVTAEAVGTSKNN